MFDFAFGFAVEPEPCKKISADAGFVFFIFGKGLGANYTWYLFLILGAVVSIITIIGDLFESFIKRRIGIKDMGKIMPGHGGVLDRIDGMSFAAIVLYIVFAIF